MIKQVSDAYLTIYAFPIYVCSIPAKLKALLDRQFIRVMPVFVPFHNLTRHPVRDKKERYMVLFSVSGFPEIKHFNPVVETFKDIARNAHTPLIATILRPAAEFFVYPPYRNYLKNILSSLEKAGKELVQEGKICKISKKILNFISSNYGISIKRWRNYANLHCFLKRKEIRNE